MIGMEVFMVQVFIIAVAAVLGCSAWADFPIGSKEWAEVQGRQERAEQARVEAESQAEQRKWKEEQKQQEIEFAQAEAVEKKKEQAKKQELAAIYKKTEEQEKISCPWFSGAKVELETGIILATQDGGTSDGFALSCVKREGERKVKHGKRMIFFPSGKKAVEMTFSNGQADGVSSEYFEDGFKWREITYKDGKQTGVTKVWGHGNNEGIYTETNFANGLKHGKEIGHSKDGEWESEYSHGIRIKHNVKMRAPASR